MAGPTEIVSLADVKAHLNISQSDQTDDVELQRLTDAVSARIEQLVGPVRQVSVTEMHDAAGADTVVVRNPPIVSVQSVTEYIAGVAWPLTLQPPGSTVDAYGYSIDNSSRGILVRRTAVGGRWVFRGDVQVAYTAGRASVPDNIREATLRWIRISWRPQRGGPYVNPTTADDAPVSHNGRVPVTDDVPMVVKAMLRGDLVASGVA